MKWIDRLRHGRGFGVHSPFAYRFITECLREQLPYYAYDTITEPLHRLVFRIAAYFRPATFHAAGIPPQIITLACHDASATGSDSADMLVYTADTTPGQLASAISRGAVVILIHTSSAQKTEIDTALSAAGHGMTFSNGHHVLIAVPWPYLPRQHFDVKF